MPIYRLEPIEDFVREQSWQHTLLKVTCWIEAANEDEARHAVARATASVPADPVRIYESPWLTPVLTMCIEETADIQMEPGITVRVNGMSQAWAASPDR
jgi:hypothetical protein